VAKSLLELEKQTTGERKIKSLQGSMKCIKQTKWTGVGSVPIIRVELCI